MPINWDAMQAPIQPKIVANLPTVPNNQANSLAGGIMSGIAQGQQIQQNNQQSQMNDLDIQNKQMAVQAAQALGQDNQAIRGQPGQSEDQYRDNLYKQNRALGMEYDNNVLRHSQAMLQVEGQKIQNENGKLQNESGKLTLTKQQREIADKNIAVQSALVQSALQAPDQGQDPIQTYNQNAMILNKQTPGLNIQPVKDVNELGAISKAITISHAALEDKQAIQPDVAKLDQLQQKRSNLETNLENAKTPEQKAKIQRSINEVQGQINDVSKTGAGKSPDSFKQANTLRDEVNKLSTPFQQVNDSYGRIQTAAAHPSAAGDIALIFNYMKMLDPGSVVREGEFATAQNAAGIPDRIRNMYNKAQNGERLNDEQRNDFVGQAQNLYKSQEQSYQQVIDDYTSKAERAGIDPKDVIVDLRVKGRDTSSGTAKTSSFTEGQVYQDANGNKATYNNGKWVEVK
jgi:hypothetical protein